MQALAKMKPLLRHHRRHTVHRIGPIVGGNIGLAIAMASEGLLTLDAGIAAWRDELTGTCATALLASLGKPVEAVRAATVHIMFNVLGVLWLPFTAVLANLAIASLRLAPIWKARLAWRLIHAGMRIRCSMFSTRCF